uniref:Protein FAM60A n=1 Tax=Corethrella appendiculata TaxID=1370023 RepID=U5EXC1_9DIPT
MFSFHKPKVYRSTTGCCICKAKSSSSRFTDSKKYEIDFLECFQLTTPRKGEICNACVLLVKRFKRLPPGSDRHWGHVVDARVGPGLKSMTKFKKRKEETQNSANGDNENQSKNSISSVPERFCKIFKKTKKKPKEEKNLSGSSDEVSNPSSPLSNHSDSEHKKLMAKKYGTNYNLCSSKRKNYQPLKNRKSVDATIIDENIWTKRKTCCGFIYESTIQSAIIIDLDFYKPCLEHVKQKSKTDIASNLIDNKFKTSINLITANKITDFASSSSNNIKDLFNINTTALKKHHLYSKRQNSIDTNSLPIMQNPFKIETTPIDNNSKNDANKFIKATENTEKYLHKLKTESIKIMKTGNGIITPAKIKSTDFNVVKNLVKMCTDRATKSSENSTNGNEIATNGKFLSDNSSDSGYEENAIIQEHLTNLKTSRSVVVVSNASGKFQNSQTQEILLVKPVGVEQPEKRNDINIIKTPIAKNILLENSITTTTDVSALVKQKFITQKQQTAN